MGEIEISLPFPPPSRRFDPSQPSLSCLIIFRGSRARVHACRAHKLLQESATGGAIDRNSGLQPRGVTSGCRRQIGSAADEFPSSRCTRHLVTGTHDVAAPIRPDAAIHPTHIHGALSPSPSLSYFLHRVICSTSYNDLNWDMCPRKRRWGETGLRLVDNKGERPSGEEGNSCSPEVEWYRGQAKRTGG